jgi:hypothetical protein
MNYVIIFFEGSICMRSINGLYVTHPQKQFPCFSW